MIFLKSHSWGSGLYCYYYDPFLLTTLLTPNMMAIFFFFSPAFPSHLEFPGQGSDLSLSCNLFCSWILNTLSQAGIEPADATNPFAL